MPEEIETVDIYPEHAAEIGIQRSISVKERDAIPADDFAGPHDSFPIDSQEHLDAAAKLIGHADDPAAVKRKAIEIAKRKGLKLPEAWQEDEKPSEERAQMPEHAMLYAPITRIDNDKWEVEGVATSEAVDSYGTVFSYDASKRAFQKWIERTANVREMHDRKAVGKGIGVFFDDAAKQVIVRSRVSRGARDTWMKIQEGILSGYSVGANNPTWSKIERGGKSYPYLVSYDLTELSYVDNASNPDGHGLSICRADGITDVVDVTEPEPEEKEEQQTPLDSSALSSPSVALERVGARHSADTQQAMHTARDGAIQSAQQLMALCDCADCQRMAAAIDPDDDGDIDLPGVDASGDPDGDAERMMAERIDRLMAPVYQRMQNTLARLASLPFDIDIDLSPVMERLARLDAIEAAIERVTSPSSLDEVRASLEAVRGQVERIAASPAPGGPVLNGARPVDKTLMSSSSANHSQQEHTLAVLERLQQTGALDTIDKQVAAAALAVVPTRGRIG